MRFFKRPEMLELTFKGVGVFLMAVSPKEEEKLYDKQFFLLVEEQNEDANTRTQGRRTDTHTHRCQLERIHHAKSAAKKRQSTPKSIKKPCNFNG